MIHDDCNAQSSLRDCRIISFKDLGDERGSLVVLEGDKNIPFEISRAFYMFGSDTGVVRGMHANRDSAFVLINVAGNSKIKVTNGTESSVFSLSEPFSGLYIPRMIWKEMYDFSPDSVLLVFSDKPYSEKEYIRDYDAYLQEMLNC